jgi:hypothetical protein
VDVVPIDHRRRCGPIVDTWWQTETGAIMVSALPGVTETKPGSAQVPLPGIGIDVVDDEGTHVGNGNGGLLVITKPWPSMLRGIWGDPERFVETYWEKFQDKGFYFAGDGARLDDDGDVWFLGRVDDVMNVSGHRLSTTEIESALVGNEAVAEAAVVGAADETTGQAVVAFCVLKESFLKAHDVDGIVDVLRRWVGEQIGPIARPRDVYIVTELPKTRSGKIMRRLLRDVAEGARSATPRRWPTPWSCRRSSRRSRRSRRLAAADRGRRQFAPPPAPRRRRSPPRDAPHAPRARGRPAAAPSCVCRASGMPRPAAPARVTTAAGRRSSSARRAAPLATEREPEDRADEREQDDEDDPGELGQVAHLIVTS